MNIVTDSFRTDWAYAVVTAAQRLVCDLFEAQREQFEAALRRFASSCPEAGTRVEALWLRNEIALTAERAAVHLHRSCSTCLAHDRKQPARRPPVDWMDLRRSSRFLILAWLLSTLRIFDQTHDCALPIRAASILKRGRPSAHNLEAVASKLEIGPHTLVRRFEQRYGLSPAEYHRRVRARIGIRALRDGMLKVDAAARRAGFDSAASLYRVLHALVGLTPSDIRQLDETALIQLWDGQLQTDPARLYRQARNKRWP